MAWVQVNELIEAREAAVEALRLKSEFLASISHEIRTPLTGVLGMTDLLLETELTSEQREYATTARQSGRALLMVLNTILDFSRIEAGHITLESGPFSPRALVDEAVTALSGSAPRKGLTIGVFVAPEAPETLHGDAGDGARDREGAGSVFWFTLRLASPSSAPEEARHVESQKKVRVAGTVLDPRVLTSLRTLEAEGEQGIVAELIGLYLAESPRQLEALRAALAAGDAPGLYRAAHGIKGSAANLGAVTLAAICRDLETLSRAGAIEGAAELVAHIEEAHRAFAQALESERRIDGQGRALDASSALPWQR